MAKVLTPDQLSLYQQQLQAAPQSPVAAARWRQWQEAAAGTVAGMADPARPCPMPRPASTPPCTRRRQRVVNPRPPPCFTTATAATAAHAWHRSPAATSTNAAPPAPERRASSRSFVYAPACLSSDMVKSGLRMRSALARLAGPPDSRSMTQTTGPKIRAFRTQGFGRIENRAAGGDDVLDDQQLAPAHLTALGDFACAVVLAFLRTKRGGRPVSCESMVAMGDAAHFQSGKRVDVRRNELDHGLGDVFEQARGGPRRDICRSTRGFSRRNAA